jgi:hypothetical protein
LGDATVVVPGGQRLNAGVININDNSALAGGTLVLGASGGPASEGTVVNTNSRNLTTADRKSVNDTAKIKPGSYGFTAPGDASAVYGVSVTDGATLPFNAPPGASVGQDLCRAPELTFDTNMSGVLQVGDLAETPAQLVALDNSVFGSGFFSVLCSVGGAGQTVDTTQLTYPAEFESEFVDSGTGGVLVQSAITGAANERKGGEPFLSFCY